MKKFFAMENLLKGGYYNIPRVISSLGFIIGRYADNHIKVIVYEKQFALLIC